MDIIEVLKKYNLTISTAESITGGQIASLICSYSGASKHFNGGIVSYTKKIKEKLLNIPLTEIEKYGVYSNETVTSMALNVAKICGSDVSISTSGVAGPGSDEGVEAGTVYFGFNIKGKVTTCVEKFSGSRNEIRNKAAFYALERMIDLIIISFK